MDSEKDSENDAGELRRRSIYLSMRIKALKDEVANLRVEETEVATNLRSSKDKKSAESKQLKSRLIYLRSRPYDARKEIEVAAEEKKKIAGLLRHEGSAGASAE